MTVSRAAVSYLSIIRIDTNQGIYGLGEVRDGAGYQYAMRLKNRLVGENPLKIDYLFQKVQQFGGISRQAGGVCAIEMALWDIARKVYNCPVYQMLGGSYQMESERGEQFDIEIPTFSMDCPNQDVLLN